MVLPAPAGEVEHTLSAAARKGRYLGITSGM